MGDYTAYITLGVECKHLICFTILVRLFLVVGRLRGPKEPHDNHGGLEGSSRPQRTLNAKGAMREDATDDGAKQQQDGSCSAAIALDILKGKQILVREQVAIDAGQHDAGQGIILEGAAGNGLAAALEGDEGQRRENGPVDGFGGRGRRVEGDDEGGGDDEEGLGGKGDAQHPAALGGEVSVEAGEEEGADAKGEERDAGAVEPWAGRRVDERGEAEADVDGVSWSKRREVNIMGLE